MGKANQNFGGDWTEQKLAVLKAYLNAYTTALKNKPFKLIYVDAFAGTGYRHITQQADDAFSEFADDDVQGFLDGSARIALAVDDRPFDEFVFIELDEAKRAELETLRRQHPSRQIAVFSGDANERLRTWLGSQSWSGKRAALFIDPFATQLEWQTLEVVAATKAIDTWILFPVGAVQRLLPTNGLPESISEAWRSRLDKIFGTDDWKQAFYRQETVPHLFGKDEMNRKVASEKIILDYFIKRLRAVFAEVSPKYKVLKNSRNSPLFGFCFAAANPRGGKIAKKIANHLLGEI